MFHLGKEKYLKNPVILNHYLQVPNWRKCYIPWGEQVGSSSATETLHPELVASLLPGLGYHFTNQATLFLLPPRLRQLLSKGILLTPAAPEQSHLLMWFPHAKGHFLRA